MAGHWKKAYLHSHKFDDYTEAELLACVRNGEDDRIYAIAQLFRLGTEMEKIREVSSIDSFFLSKIKNIVKLEQRLKKNPKDIQCLYEAKRKGFSDKAIGDLWKMEEEEIVCL